MIDIRANDARFSADAFLALAQRVWPRDYEPVQVAAALARTHNVGAWHGDRLVGAVRVLTDGYFFACVSEILVEPAYQRQGLGRRLMEAALAASQAASSSWAHSRSRWRSSSASGIAGARSGSSRSVRRGPRLARVLPSVRHRASS